MIHTDKAFIGTDKVANRTIKLLRTAGIAIFAIALLGSCVKDELYNTPHPDKGAVKITTDWSEASSDAQLPDSYLLRIGDEEQAVSGATNAFNTLFTPGKQDLLVYHNAEGFTVSGTTATVNTLPDGTLEPLPGYLFSGTKTLDIVMDDTLRVTLPMQQHTRSLTLALKLNPGDELRIATVLSTLSGIAPAVDLTTGAIAATEGKTVAPTFDLTTVESRTRTAGQPALSAHLRLLGAMTAEKQILTLAITLTNGQTQTLTTDLTEALKNFGSSIEPLELDATLNLPQEGSFEATISDWNEVKNGDLDIN